MIWERKCIILNWLHCTYVSMYVCLYVAVLSDRSLLTTFCVQMRIDRMSIPISYHVWQVLSVCVCVCTVQCLRIVILDQAWPSRLIFKKKNVLIILLSTHLLKATVPFCTRLFFFFFFSSSSFIKLWAQLYEYVVSLWHFLVLGWENLYRYHTFRQLYGGCIQVCLTCCWSRALVRLHVCMS